MYSTVVDSIRLREPEAQQRSIYTSAMSYVAPNSAVRIQDVYPNQTYNSGIITATPAMIPPASAR